MVAAPEHEATPSEFTLTMILVYDPETKQWEQVYNTFHGAPPKMKLVMDGGRARVT